MFLLFVEKFLRFFFSLFDRASTVCLDLFWCSSDVICCSTSDVMHLGFGIVE
jgi:hypothetical protein